MDITNDTKAKVFAQYLGQHVAIAGKKYKLGTLITSNRKEVDLFYAIDNVSQLILKPLSKISESDAVLVAKQCGYDEETFGIERLPAIGKRIAKSVIKLNTEDLDCLQIVFAYQYLQSMGYDMPNHYLNGKNLYEAGLAIYE